MKTNPNDSLQQDILQEKAQVLATAGRRVDAALTRLANLQAQIAVLKDGMGGESAPAAAVTTINDAILRFNGLRERARQRYYELMVIREALGLRNHDRIAEIYAIPSRIPLLTYH